MEEYAIIKNHPYYAISNFGNSVINIKTGKNCKLFMVLGYKKVSCDNKPLRVGRTVLEAFTDIPTDTTFTCDHINQNKTDDRLENLRWASKSLQSVNQNHKIGLSKEKHISIEKIKGHTYYRVRINRKDYKITKSFKNLNEAIKYRDLIIKDYNINDII